MNIHNCLLPVAICSVNTMATWIAGWRSTRSVPGGTLLTHASPVWWGFASADDRTHLEAFLRKSAKLGYWAKRSTTFASICDDADCKLFTRITDNTQHLLYPLLPPEREHHYNQSLRQRSHNFQLPDHTTILRDKNFVMRKLYCDAVI